jgi:AraC-like DNA-binding protein
MKELKLICRLIYLKELSQDYSSSKLFSEMEGVTIEHYFIAQKLKTKSCLFMIIKNLSEIAIQLNYSNVAYLSNQFKKVTGFTTHFKKWEKILENK